jgi:hypothetical protein
MDAALGEPPRQATVPQPAKGVPAVDRPAADRRRGRAAEPRRRRVEPELDAECECADVGVPHSQPGSSPHSTSGPDPRPDSSGQAASGRAATEAVPAGAGAWPRGDREHFAWAGHLSKRASGRPGAGVRQRPARRISGSPVRDRARLEMPSQRHLHPPRQVDQGLVARLAVGVPNTPHGYDAWPMSREPRQGRGRNSLSPQRSPEELAALLAHMADVTGDPEPRAGGADRPGVLPSGFPAPVVTRRRKAPPAAKPSPAIAEIARPNGKPSRKAKPPSRSSSTSKQPAAKPDRTDVQSTSKAGPGDSGAGNGLIAGTPISQPSGSPRPARPSRGATPVGRRSIRRGDRPKRLDGDAPAEPRPRSRAAGRIGGAGRTGGTGRIAVVGRIGAASRSRHTSRRPRRFPAHSGRRRWTLVLIGLLALVLLALVLIGGSGNSPTSAGSKVTTIPVSTPSGATAPATPPAPPAASTSAATPSQPAAGASTKTKAKSTPAAHQAKPAAHKAKPAAHKATPAAHASTPPPSAPSSITPSSPPTTSSFTPAPVYRAPAPRAPPRQALTGAGSLSSGAGSLTHRRARHHKH